MPHLPTPRLALALVASGPLAAGALDRALLLPLLPQPLEGTPHG